MVRVKTGLAITALPLELVVAIDTDTEIVDGFSKLIEVCIGIFILSSAAVKLSTENAIAALNEKSVFI